MINYSLVVFFIVGVSNWQFTFIDDSCYLLVIVLVTLDIDFEVVIYFWSWYLYVDLVCGVGIGWVSFQFWLSFFLSSLCYPWGSFGYQDSLPRIILWFDYLCVDRTLSLLHSGSESLIRWPHGQEVVYSYHLGPPQMMDAPWYSGTIIIISLIFKTSIHLMYLYSHTLWHA